ncbi:MAG TPA: choice-of-anchor J domain-containing protein [Clostridiales bacterium]|nr:choice-of-anchor J domain-containing protein [Clostridiales bacterium]HQP70535.1 choice-of-anchor J domain-containing protein [Clostridiales bacterium]
MKKLVMMLIAVISAAAFAMDFFPLSEAAKEKIQQDGNKAYTWKTYCGTPTYTYSTVTERAMYVNANDFGLDYPVNFGGVQSLLNDAGITSHYRIYAKDGTTKLWEKEFTTTKVGYEVVSPDSADFPIVLNDDFYLVHVPYLPGDGKGYPRIWLDAGDGIQGHAFYGSPGSWTNRNPYSYVMYAALEQYTGADVNPPSARFVYGANAFMDYDANIVLAVSDESSMSTLTGAYTVNGTDWLNVELTASKANHFEYSGTIPAQPDGGVGQVVFFMYDNLGQYAESEPFELSWSKDNPIYTQSFEGFFPPYMWSTDNVGAGFIQANNTTSQPVPHGGLYMAAHMDDPGTQDDWLISPLISVPADNSTTLTFWQSGWFLNYLETGMHEVGVSTDMGTWDVIYTGHPPVGASGAGDVWEKIYLSLSAYKGQDIYIGFHYVADYEDQWFIDDMEVLYDYEGPTIVSLMGNEALDPIIGAYLNNEMVLNLTVNDLSGVQSVIGHYSFDEGSTVIDLPFTQAKGGDEVWTAAIPAQAAVDSGYIDFDLTDIGGIVGTDSTMFRIDFVTDNDAPIFNFVKGTMAFVGSPMNLEISISDESAMTSCAGFYSKDGVTYTPFEMTQAKIHDYVFTGSIPAETDEVLDGKVYFGMQDAEGHIGYSDVFTVKWMDGQNNYVEDFESGAGNWILTGNWAIVEEGQYISSSHALTESPGGNYADEEVNSSAQWATPMDFTANPGVEISFWTRYDIEEDFDYMYFEGSEDGGTTWIRLQTYSMEGIGWHQEVIPMNAFAGKDGVTFRFLFESDGGYNAEGMYIDDLVVTSYDVDHGVPTIISDPYAPAFYEGVVGDYTDAVEIMDFSGIANATVHYSVDGGAEQSVSAVNTTENFYEFTIPAQSAGSQVNYRIYALDSSAQANEFYSPYYSYIAGDHMIYDSGIVSYYQTIEENNAKAVKVTVPGSDESKTIMEGKLSYILFRNYADASHVSADMKVHVWDDNAGVPGTELITAFDVTSEGLAMTRVDMRAYDLSVFGDFWVGVSAPYGIVYLTMEAADEEAVTAYERSYTGTWDAGTSTYTWAQAPTDNWHFRAVLNGIYTGIEDVNVPMVTKLEQNYPNPFNPATTINFSLAKDSKVSLVVYDVMGREVANLVNGEMTQGSHKVSFDASRLVSGVYYYNLKAAGVNQTRKMMLIK